MKSLLIAVAILLLSVGVKAQDKATLVAQDACHCLDSLKNLPFKARTDSCLTKTAVKALMIDSKLPGKGTVEAIQGFFKDVNREAYKNCPEFRQAYNEDASSVYDKLSKNEKANSLYRSGTEKMQDNNYDEAIADLQAALKLDKTFLYAIDHLAVCYRQKKDYNTALEYYKRSLEIFPAGNLSLLNTAVVYTLKKDNKNALAYYERLKFFYPKDAEGYFGASKLLAANGDFEPSLDNAFAAFFIYRDTQSPYMADMNTLLQIIYHGMKAKNLQDVFQKKADQYHVKLNIE